MTGRWSKWTRRTFNRALLLGGAGAVAGACARRALSPAPSRAALPAPPPWEEGLEAVLEAGRLRLTYRLTPATSERLKLPPVQGTVVVAINSYTQLPICRPLSAGKSLEWKGPVAIDGGGQWTASVDPLELLVLGQASGLWFLHASMMQYRSAVLALELGG